MKEQACAMMMSVTSKASMTGPSTFTTTTATVTATATATRTATPAARETVTFRPTVTAHLVLHISDYAICERRDAWYGPADLLCMRKEVHELAKQIDTRDGHPKEKEGEGTQSQKHAVGTKLSTATVDGYYYFYHYHRDGYSSLIRGVERKTKRGGMARTRNRNQALMAVFREQYMQWKLDVQDPDALARLYSNASRTCQMEALWMGLVDAAEAQQQQVAAHQYNDDVDCRNNGLSTIDETMEAAFPSLMDSRAMNTIEKEEFGNDSKSDSLDEGSIIDDGEGDAPTATTTTTRIMQLALVGMKMVSITNAAA